jgi:phosphoglycolate phosphatase
MRLRRQTASVSTRTSLDVGFDASEAGALLAPAGVRYSLILFDLDGTLVDSLPDIAAALNQGLAALGRAPFPLDDVRSLVGEGVVRLAEKALARRPAAAGQPSDPALAQELADQVRGIYRARPCVHSRLYPGIAELLERLRGDPARRLSVLTNKPGEVTRPLLAALGIEALFHAVVGDGDGHPRKPDPAAARALLARFGAAPAQALMIGDGLPDLQVARAVGCDAAAALWGYTPQPDLAALSPTYLLAAPADVLALV